jgi:multicomponent Na+:H+ antiporter subunit E
MMTKKLLMNLLLMLVWVALTGSFVVGNFIFGFALSFGVMWLIRRRDQPSQYFVRLINVIGFILYFLYELTKANLQVALDVLKPRFSMRPGIIKIPLHAKTDLEITLLANMISLTPGSLIIDVSDDKKVLYVHAIDIHDRDEYVRKIKTGFERRLLEVMR